MVDVNENKEIWNTKYDWKSRGDEWSSEWGGVKMQWSFSIYPRVHSLVPADTILEIAPGFGRWAQFLVPLCKNLVLVDLSEKCIQICKERFTNNSHISYHTNDGKSLDMIENNSIDFVFSFDSLVHVEEDVIESYLAQLAAKLKQDAVGFIHHSNLGAYPNYFSLVKGIPGYRMKKLLSKSRLIDDDHGRAITMTASKFQHYAEKAGLHCISQELVNWGGKRLIDCFSTFVKKGGSKFRPNKIVRNQNFMREALCIKSLSNLYG